MDPATANGNGKTAVEMVRSQQQRREELWNERGMMDTPEQQAAFREYKEESNQVAGATRRRSNLIFPTNLDKTGDDRCSSVDQ